MKDRLARQRSAWVWAACLAQAAAVLPAAAARGGAGGWVAPVLALPLLWVIGRLTEGATVRGVCGLPDKGSRVLTIIYIMWAVVLGGVQLRAAVRRVETAAELPAEPWVLAVGLVLLALWLVRGSPAACARWSALVLNGLLAVVGAVVLLALRQVRWDNLLPLWGDGKGVLGTVGVTVAVLCVRVYGGFVPGAGASCVRRYPVLVCALLCGVLLTVQGNLGTALAAGLEDPLLTLSRNVGVEGTFQRAESVLAAVLLLGDLALLTLLLWAMRSAAGKGWPAAGGAMLAAAVLPMPAQQMELIRYRVVPAGNFILGLAVPLILLVIGRGKTGKTGAYIVPENGENGTY